MQVPPAPVVEQPIRHVRRLLHLEQHHPGPDRMHRPGIHKHHIAHLDRHHLQQRLQRPVRSRLPHILDAASPRAAHTRPSPPAPPPAHTSTRFCRAAAPASRLLVVRMHLHGKLLARKQHLHQQRKLAAACTPSRSTALRARSPACAPPPRRPRSRTPRPSARPRPPLPVAPQARSYQGCRSVRPHTRSTNFGFT